MPGDAEGLQQVARFRPEMDHVAVRHRGAAVEGDAQKLAHAAGAAVAAGKEVAAHLLGRPGLHRAQGRDDAGLVLLEILQGDTPAGIDQRMAADGIAQHGLDHHLAHAHGGLARLGPVVAGQDLRALVRDARIAEAMELAAARLAGQRRDPGDVEVVLLQHSHRAQPPGHAQAAKQLHRAAVGDVHLGMARRRRMTLDQQAAHTMERQRAGERHAHRPAARDQDGDSVMLSEAKHPCGVRKILRYAQDDRLAVAFAAASFSAIFCFNCSGVRRTMCSFWWLKMS